MKDHQDSERKLRDIIHSRLMSNLSNREVVVGSSGMINTIDDMFWNFTVHKKREGSAFILEFGTITHQVKRTIRPEVLTDPNGKDAAKKLGMLVVEMVVNINDHLAKHQKELADREKSLQLFTLCQELNKDFTSKNVFFESRETYVTIRLCERSEEFIRDVASYIRQKVG